MFERFTDSARRAMALANLDALRRGNDHIGTEHILLGVIEEGTGISGAALVRLGINLGAVQFHLDKLVRAWVSPVTDRRLPQTPRAKKVIEAAIEEARSLNHGYVGTEHILLGIIRETDGVAAQVLMNLGVDLARARHCVLDAMEDVQPPPWPAPLPVPSGVLSSLAAEFRGSAAYTARWVKIMDLAVMESRRFRHEYVATEHLLLALLRDSEGIGAVVLKSFGIDLSAIEIQVTKQVPPGPERPIQAEPVLTPRARQVIHYASEEAELAKRPVDSEHVLLALLRESDGVAWSVLTNLRVTIDMARQRVTEEIERTNRP